MSRIFLDSSAGRPWRATSSSVISGCARTSARESRMASFFERTTGGNRREYLQPVFAAEEFVRCVFRMRHQTENIPGFIADTGNVFEGTVRIGGRSRFPLAVDVPKQDLAIFFDPFEGHGIRVVTAFAVLYGYPQHLPFRHFTGKRRIGLFHPERDQLANKL